ncbi:unnamed protein product [Lampetra fluviatilis]
MQPAAQLPARPPIAAGEEIRNAHGRLAQLLHAAASILEEINLGAAGGVDRPPADVPAIGNQEEFEFPAGGSRASAGSGNQVHAGNVESQSRHAASSARDAASASCSDNATPSQQRRCTVDIVGQAIVAFGIESEQAEDEETAALKQRLPVFCEFTSTGGDWATFQRRFLSHQEMVG